MKLSVERKISIISIGVSGLSIGSATAMAAKTEVEVRFAVASFVFAAVLFSFTASLCALRWHAPTWIRMTTAFLFCAVIGVTTLKADRWARQRYLENQVSLCSPKLLALPPALSAMVSGPTVGRIRQGAGSALSINQKGGVTLGRLTLQSPPSGDLVERTVAFFGQIREEMPEQQRIHSDSPYLEQVCKESEFFRYRFSKRLIEIRDEFAVLHLRDREIDEFLANEESESRMHDFIVSTMGPTHPPPALISRQQINEIADHLQMLASHLRLVKT